MIDIKETYCLVTNDRGKGLKFLTAEESSVEKEYCVQEQDTKDVLRIT